MVKGQNEGGEDPQVGLWASQRRSEFCQSTDDAKDITSPHGRFSEPEGFYVQGSEGPLREGELERAGAWAQQVADAA